MLLIVITVILRQKPLHPDLLSFSVSENGPVQYTLVETLMSWPEARAYCRSKYTDLASILNQQIQLQIESIVRRRSWIGLHRSPWLNWSNGTRTRFTNWHMGQPDKDEASCAVINATTGTWWDVPCRANYPFVCYKSVVVPDAFSARHKIRFQSKADLKDPALQRQLLEQVLWHYNFCRRQQAW